MQFINYLNSVSASLSIVLFATSATAFASSPFRTYHPSSLHDFSGPYFSAQIGFFEYDSPGSSYYNGYYYYDDDYETGFTARFATGYQWDVNRLLKLSIEPGINFYQNLSVYCSCPISHEYERTSIDLLGGIDLFFTPRFDFFFKVGTAYVWFEDHSFNNGFEFDSYKASGFVPKLVFGFGYNLYENLNINVSFNNEFKVDNHSRYIKENFSMLFGIKYVIPEIR